MTASTNILPRIPMTRDYMRQLIRENLKQGHTAEAEKLMGHLPEINTAG